ncbi:SDR family NAD(P)-dependent oxidoreductase [Yinghuangia seranimata]|uniref:SDR family NAD(P)-dependent oxidoreductase n=1 Tax=Yinghuangia seranimata TaxID=408067 RepID=UPI00248D1B51|nr:SDR family NAD(P)-dependent oxidoreductase [Yinghuangia seranimata]MDI2128129.1 SDR family NAD(P)-dependent oxidoreductase [Yinghuangia seranimata]
MAVGIDLGGRAALVTGGGAGIGRAVCVQLARAGADVAVADLRGAAAEETAALVAAEGVRAAALTFDATDAEQVAATVAEAAARLGGLDIAVNNVGMTAGHGTAAFVDWTPQAVRDVVGVNLLATAYSCQAEARAMIAAGRGGCIVNVSSGETTRPAPGLAPYGAAKAGVNHLTQTLAVELAPHRIRVNAVAPGTTLTEQVAASLSADFQEALLRSVPLGALSQPEDMARLVLFLASDLAAHTTGQFVLSDNGAFLSRSRPPYEHNATG